MNGWNIILLFFLIVCSAFFSTLTLTRVWIKIAKKSGLTGKDMNKYDKREVAEAGGIAVVMGICFSILLYVFIKTFYFFSTTNLIDIMAILVTVLLAGFIGFTDDILGWKKGLAKWQKPLLTIFIAAPLAVVNAGNSNIDIPLLGTTDVGIIYPILLVPLGVVGAANGFNMLAGLNGLEASLSSVILGTLGLFALSKGYLWVATIAFLAVASLAAFLMFNRYPAKVFPGNTLTYSIGALIACTAIVGNMEKVGVLLFLPYILEFLIKLKNKFKTECFGIPLRNGLLKPPKKIGSLTHVLMMISKSEKGVVHLFVILELLIAVLLFILFKPF